MGEDAGLDAVVLVVVGVVGVDGGDGGLFGGGGEASFPHTLRLHLMPQHRRLNHLLLNLKTQLHSIMHLSLYFLQKIQILFHLRNISPLMTCPFLHLLRFCHHYFFLFFFTAILLR